MAVTSRLLVGCSCSELAILHKDHGSSTWSDLGLPQNFPDTNTSHVGGYGFLPGHSLMRVVGEDVYFLFAFDFNSGDVVTFAHFNFINGWTTAQNASVSHFLLDSVLSGGSLIALTESASGDHAALEDFVPEGVTATALPDLNASPTALVPIGGGRVLVFYSTNTVNGPRYRAVPWSASAGWGPTIQRGPSRSGWNGIKVGKLIYAAFPDGTWTRFAI